MTGQELHDIINYLNILMRSKYEPPIKQSLRKAQEVNKNNTDRNLHVKYQNPSSSHSQDITRFLHSYDGRVEKGALLSQYFMKPALKVFRSSKH